MVKKLAYAVATIAFGVIGGTLAALLAFEGCDFQRASDLMAVAAAGAMALTIIGLAGFVVGGRDGAFHALSAATAAGATLALADDGSWRIIAIALVIGIIGGAIVPLAWRAMVIAVAQRETPI